MLLNLYAASEERRVERRRRAMELLSAVGLAERTNHRQCSFPVENSREWLWLCLASRPKFVLADEPTANLDSIPPRTFGQWLN